MEPKQTPGEQSLSGVENLHKITPLSKYLAMILFIVLPFLGVWIGYRVAVSHSVDEIRCPVEVTFSSLEAGLALDDPESFTYRAALFFNRVSLEMINVALGSTPAGGVMQADELFSSRDTRWRLTRPVPTVDDPDALVIAPPQSQYLIQPAPNTPYAALVLVGPPKNGNITWPAAAGLLPESDGYFFTIEPTSPETCQIKPSKAEDWVTLALAEQSAVLNDTE